MSSETCFNKSQYAILINTYLYVPEFTPNTKEEIPSIIAALQAITHSNNRHSIKESLKERVQALQELKDDWDNWVPNEEQKDLFLKLINDLIEDRIKKVEDENRLQQHQNDYKWLTEQQEVSKKNKDKTEELSKKREEEAFATQNKGTTLESNFLKLINAGYLADIEIGQLVSLYKKDQIDILRDKTIVDAIVAKTISLENAMKYGFGIRLVISKKASTDDLEKLGPVNRNAIYIECFVELIELDRIPFKVFEKLTAEVLTTLLLSAGRNLMLYDALFNANLSFVDYMEIAKDTKLFKQMMTPGVLDLLILGEITSNQLKTIDDPIIIKLLEISKKQEARAKQVNIENPEGNKWLQRTEVIRFGSQSKFKRVLKITHIFLSVLFIGATVLDQLFTPVNLLATPFLLSIEISSFYLLAYDYIHHRTNLIADPSPPLSLLKRIICVTATIFCLWIDPIPSKYRAFFLLGSEAIILASALAICVSRTRIENADRWVRRYASVPELSGGRDFLSAEQKRNQEERQKSWWNWMVYNDRGDYLLSIIEPSSSIRINRIVNGFGSLTDSLFGLYL
jgi:hypothetical protein